MDLLNDDVLKIILNEVGHHTCPMKFYELRIVSKAFKDVINEYSDGFYHYLKNQLFIINNVYKSIIEERILFNKHISMKMGFNIIKLDDWIIEADNYTHTILSYPKYEEVKDHNFIYMNEYKQEQTRIRKDTKYVDANDYEITMNIREKYYNMMIKYNYKFQNIRKKNIEYKYGIFMQKYSNPNPYENVVTWLKNNGELNIN